MAAEVIGSVAWDLDLDDKNFKGKLNVAKDQAEGFGGHLDKIGDSLKNLANQSAIFAGLVGGGIALGLKSSIDAWKEQESVLRQQEQVLKSTHNAAGLYIEDLQDQAAELQMMTAFSDDAISSGQNLLLTFTNIKGINFQLATQTMLDMSQALGQDLKSSAIQLGKALNDPIKGITALSRVGVSFTEQQKEQIETLVRSGKTMEAQKVILNELNTEFGGSAIAAGETFAGKLAILNNMFGELQESAGKAIVTAITPLIGSLTELAQNVDFEKIIRGLSFIKGIFDSDSGNRESALFDTLTTFVDDDTADKLTNMLMPLVNQLKGLSDWVGANKALVITFLQGLGVALGALLILGTITILVTAFTNPLVVASLAIAALYTAWQTNFLGIRDITTAVVTEVVNFWTSYLMPAVAMVAGYISERWTYIAAITQGAWNIITGIIQIAWSVVYGTIKVGLAVLSGDWGAAWNAIKQMVSGAWDGIKRTFDGILSFISGWGGLLIQNLTSPFRTAWSQIEGLLKKIKDGMDFTKRHSPSVLDIVSRGVDLVNKEFQSLSDITLPSVSHALTDRMQSAQAGGDKNVNVFVEKINNAGDVESINREIGFKLATS